MARSANPKEFYPHALYQQIAHPGLAAVSVPDARILFFLNPPFKECLNIQRIVAVMTKLDGLKRRFAILNPSTCMNEISTEND